MKVLSKNVVNLFIIFKLCYNDSVDSFSLQERPVKMILEGLLYGREEKHGKNCCKGN